MNKQDTLQQIPGFDGNYCIDMSGNVWSNISNRYLKPRVNHRGYCQISLTRDKASKNYRIHRLVAQTYLPNPENLAQVNHKDGEKTNNNLSNLEWCDAFQNIRHAFDNGLFSTRKGEGNKHSKLLYEDVLDIRLFASKGIGVGQIARLYPVGRQNIAHIINGRSWQIQEGEA